MLYKYFLSGQVSEDLCVYTHFLLLSIKLNLL